MTGRSPELNVDFQDMAPTQATPMEGAPAGPTIVALLERMVGDSSKFDGQSRGRESE
jgi:hypothetical protein